MNRSNSNKGTGPTMNFRKAGEGPPAIAQAPTLSLKTSAPKTILLVELDSRTRMLARTGLEWKGYRIVETDSSSLALTVWPRQADNVDLLFTDLTGAMSGPELAERLRKAKPTLKVLFSCDSKKRPNEAAQLRAQELVTKPFTSI